MMFDKNHFEKNCNAYNCMLRGERGGRGGMREGREGGICWILIYNIPNSGSEQAQCVPLSSLPSRHTGFSCQPSGVPSNQWLPPVNIDFIKTPFNIQDTFISCPNTLLSPWQRGRLR